jgi:hypothetical protein
MFDTPALPGELLGDQDLGGAGRSGARVDDRPLVESNLIPVVDLLREIKDFLAEDGPGWAVFRQEVAAGGNAESTSAPRECPRPSA